MNNACRPSEEGMRRYRTRYFKRGRRVMSRPDAEAIVDQVAAQIINDIIVERLELGVAFDIEDITDASIEKDMRITMSEVAAIVDRMLKEGLLKEGDDG